MTVDRRPTNSATIVHAWRAVHRGRRWRTRSSAARVWPAATQGEPHSAREPSCHSHERVLAGVVEALLLSQLALASRSSGMPSPRTTRLRADLHAAAFDLTPYGEHEDLRQS